MSEFCTCGAELPPDALFCHKCGKPQREISAHVEEEPAVSVPVEMAVPPPVREAPLSAANEVLTDLKAGKVVGRVVLVP